LIADVVDALCLQPTRKHQVLVGHVADSRPHSRRIGVLGKAGLIDVLVAKRTSI
jgi:hypothetical protein